MKKILFSLIVILLCSCKDSKEDLKSKFPNSELKDISFLNRSFYIPKHFTNASLDSIVQNKMSYADSTDGLFLNKLQYQQLLQSNAQFEYFIDKSNPGNSITLILGEYISLNKNVMNTFADMLQTRALLENKDQVQRQLIEKKFYNLSYADVVKVKLKSKNDNKGIYLTQYLISKNSKTITMIVRNSENEDYNHLIKNFSF